MKKGEEVARHEKEIMVGPQAATSVGKCGEKRGKHVGPGFYFCLFYA